MSEFQLARDVLTNKMRTCERMIANGADELLRVKSKYDELQKSKDEYEEVIASCKAALAALYPDPPAAAPDLTGKLMRVAPGTEGYTAGRLVKVVKRNGTQKDTWHVVFQDLGTDAYLTTEELVDAPNDYHQKAKFREGDKVVVTGDPGHGRIGTVTSYRFPEKGVPVNVVVKFVDGANGSYDEALLAKHTPPMWKAGDPVMVRRVNDANIPIAGGGRFADVIGYVKLEEGVVRVRFSAGDMGEYHETNLESRA
jgi:hypothetical protein